MFANCYTPLEIPNHEITTIEGSVELYTDRCIVALLSLEKETVFWPTCGSEDRISIKRHIREISGFPSCLGFIDGTLIPLESKPMIDGEDYYSRKGKYGISTLIVCDDAKRIRYIYAGWPGCAHDMRVYENSALGIRPHQFFSRYEYLLADSGYSPNATIIPAFKRLPSQPLTREQTIFNYRLSNIRVRVEHCIGILKARFQSLRGLRILIRSKNDVVRCVRWIRACAVLHNMLLEEPLEDDWLADEPGEEHDVDSAGAGSQGATPGEALGKAKRRNLMEIVLGVGMEM